MVTTSSYTPKATASTAHFFATRVADGRNALSQRNGIGTGYNLIKVRVKENWASRPEKCSYRKSLTQVPHRIPLGSEVKDNQRQPRLQGFGLH